MLDYKSGEYPLTEEQIAYFRGQVEHFVKLFGLTEWTVYFEADESAGCFACFSLNALDCVGTVTLSKTWHDREPTERNLSETAAHEVIHLVLGHLTWLSNRRFITQEQLDAAEEGAVRRLVNAFFSEG